MSQLNQLDCDPIVFITETTNLQNNSQNQKNIISDNNGDLFDVSKKFYNVLNFKIAFILFFIYYILNTDLFVEHGLNYLFNGVYDIKNDKITEKGIVISGIVLSITYIFIDFLHNQQFI